MYKPLYECLEKEVRHKEYVCFRLHSTQHEEKLICALRNYNSAYLWGGKVVTRRVQEGGCFQTREIFCLLILILITWVTSSVHKSSVSTVFLGVILLVSYTLIKS